MYLTISCCSGILFLKVLEQGLKKGSFLSSASCTPRKRKDAHTATAPATATNGGKKAKKLPFKVKEEAAPASTASATAGPAAKELKKSACAQGSPDEAGGSIQPVPGKKREIGVTPKRLLEPLATICKAKKLGRKAALKQVWCYIRAKKLLDPKDKSRILCDDRLRKITKSKVVASKALCGFLKEFMVPIKAS
jgi:chromatin remodeling complex protein RSC6